MPPPKMTSLRARPVAVGVRAVQAQGPHGRLVRIVDANGMKAPACGGAENVSVLAWPALRAGQEHEQPAPCIDRRRRVDGQVGRFARGRGRRDAAVGGRCVDLALHRCRRGDRQDRCIAGGRAGAVGHLRAVPVAVPGDGGDGSRVAGRGGGAGRVRPGCAAIDAELPLVAQGRTARRRHREGRRRPGRNRDGSRLGGDGWWRWLAGRPAR